MYYCAFLSCRCESNSAHHSMSKPPAESPSYYLIHVPLPGQPASSGFIFPLIKQLIYSDLLASVQNPGQVIRGEWLKIPLKNKNNSFRGYMRRQPDVFFWLHHEWSVPLSPHRMQTHAPSCSSLTPFKIGLGYCRYARHYFTVFRSTFARFEDVFSWPGDWRRQKSFTNAMNAPAKGKRHVVQNNLLLWQVLFAF